MVDCSFDSACRSLSSPKYAPCSFHRTASTFRDAAIGWCVGLPSCMCNVLLASCVYAWKFLGCRLSLNSGRLAWMTAVSQSCLSTHMIYVAGSSSGCLKVARQRCCRPVTPVQCSTCMQLRSLICFRACEGHLALLHQVHLFLKLEMYSCNYAAVGLTWPAHDGSCVLLLPRALLDH